MKAKRLEKNAKINTTLARTESLICLRTYFTSKKTVTKFEIMNELLIVCCAINKRVNKNKNFVSLLRVGIVIGKYPWTTIIITFVIFAAMACGMLKFTVSTDDEFLWTPYGSDVS